MHSILRSVIASCLVVSSGASATTLLSDTFDSDTENWDTDDHSVTQSGGALVVTDSGGAGATRAYSNFDSPVTLAIGEQLTFSAEVFLTTAATSTLQRALNIALSNGDGTAAYVNRISAGGPASVYGEGHYFNGTLGATDNNLIVDVGMLGDLIEVGSVSGVPSIRTNGSDSAYSHTVTFTLARTDASTMVLTTMAELGNGSFRSFTATDSTATNFTFSRLDVGTFGNSDYDFNLDDVSVVVEAIPTADSTITAVDFDAATKIVTLRFTDSGAAAYTVESDADLDFSAGVTDYPLDGSEDTVTYPGEIEFSFTDSTATGGTHFWRVRSE